MSIYEQILQILGITDDPVLQIVLIPAAAILLLVIVQDTLGTIFKGLFGGYDK